MAGGGGVERDKGDGEKGGMMEKNGGKKLSLCNCAISNSTAMY